MLTWKEEIFRAFLLAFGTGQIIANASYLLKKNGINLARRQHQELPNYASDKMMKIKVTCMFLAGVMFFMVSSISYIFHSYFSLAILGSLILFSIYAISEAIYYKYWKTTGFAMVSVILLGVYAII